MSEYILSKHVLEFKDPNCFVENLWPRVKSCSVIMMGESTHGTSEFYRYRAEITKALIIRHKKETELNDVEFILCESDWPEMYGVNQFILGKTENMSARDVLLKFNRWPTWYFYSNLRIWANQEILEFIEWLREENRNRRNKIKMFGMDLYSLVESAQRVLDILESSGNNRLRKLCHGVYFPILNFMKPHNLSSCISILARDPNKYIKSTEKVLREIITARVCQDDGVDWTDLEQNARIVFNAILYYTALSFEDAYTSEDRSWNIRDRHMMETIEFLLQKYGQKCIVWAHNTHIGDHRATSMVDRGLVNVGGLSRSYLGHGNVFLLGFATYEGYVIASDRWDGLTEEKRIPTAIEESVDGTLHKVTVLTGYSSFYFFNDISQKDFQKVVNKERGQRAIGVVYRPCYDGGNYVNSKIGQRYDSIIFVDKTTAILPLNPLPYPTSEFPLTYPSGK